MISTQVIQVDNNINTGNTGKVEAVTWLSPLLELRKTSNGLVPGGLVACQKPSESRLVIAVGGSIDILHWPREQAGDRPAWHSACT